MQHHQAISTAVSSGRSSAKATSDGVLVELIANGDRDAMRLLFARHNVRVFRFIVRMVGDDATAEDLVSDVFLEVWRGAERFRARSQVLTWILGIARFKALSALRQRHARALDEELDESIEDSGGDPEGILQTGERSAILQTCLRQLSSSHRQVLDLVYYHEQSIEDVARILGVPQNTVKTRVFYARRRIAELLAERGLERACL